MASSSFFLDRVCCFPGLLSSDTSQDSYRQPPMPSFFYFTQAKNTLGAKCCARRVVSGSTGHTENSTEGRAGCPGQHWNKTWI